MGWVGTITDAGRAMLAQIVSGDHTLTILDATSGTGTRDVSELAGATSLVSEHGAITIAEVQKRSDCTRVWTRVKADTTGYTVKEIGVWAKVDNGARTLFSIHQNSDGVVVPASSEDPNFIFDLICTFSPSNTDNFSVTVDPTSLVTQEEIEDVLRFSDQELTDEEIEQVRENLGITDEELFGSDHENVLGITDDTVAKSYPTKPGIYRFSGSQTPSLPDSLYTRSGILMIVKRGSFYLHLALAYGAMIAYYGVTTSAGVPVWRRFADRSDGSAYVGSLSYQPPSGSVSSTFSIYSGLVTLSATIKSIDTSNLSLLFKINTDSFKPAASTIGINGYIVQSGQRIPAKFSVTNDGNIFLSESDKSNITEIYLAGSWAAK